MLLTAPRYEIRARLTQAGAELVEVYRTTRNYLEGDAIMESGHCPAILLPGMKLAKGDPYWLDLEPMQWSALLLALRLLFTGERGGPFEPDD